MSTSGGAASESAGDGPQSSPSRRDQIVAIAMGLFAQKGFQAVSVREIADHSGILSGSLYTHFTSKSELLDLGLRPYTRVALTDVRTVAESDMPSRQKLTALLQQSFARMVEWRSAAAVMYRDWEYLSANEDFAYLREFNEEIQELWVRTLRGAVDDGTLSPDLDPDVVWRLVLAIMEGTAQRYNPQGRFPVNVVSEYPLRMLFGGLDAGASEAVAAPAPAGR